MNKKFSALQVLIAFLVIFFIAALVFQNEVVIGITVILGFATAFAAAASPE